MQISTNRVHFTNSSVSQFNYVKFLSKFRSTRNGIQDIVNVLHLGYTDDFYPFGAGISPKSKCLRSSSNSPKNIKALVLYVPKKKLKLNIKICVRWFRSVILFINREYDTMRIECDIRTGVVMINVFVKSKRNMLYVIKYYKLYWESFHKSQMLLNWFMSSIAESNHLKNLLNSQDLKNVGIHYCTHLLAAGVLRQIADKDAPTENTFKPNLMYFWAHTEVPASQPVTPGRLDMSAWPPDREHPDYIMQEQVSNHLENNRFFNQNNNEEISDLSDAKIIISQLKIKLQELEYQIEKYKFNNQIESLNRNLERSFDTISEYNLSKKSDLISKEVQTSPVSTELKLSNKPVINLPEYDPLRTNVNNEITLDISSIECKNEWVIKEFENKPDIRSEKIENYCKLNKSRDCNKSLHRDELSENDVDDAELRIQNEKKKLPDTTGLVDYHSINAVLTSVGATHDISSDASLLSFYTSTDLMNNRTNSSEASSSDLNKTDDFLSKHDVHNVPVTQILYTHNDTKPCPTSETSLSSIELLSNAEQDSSKNTNKMTGTAQIPVLKTLPSPTKLEVDLNTTASSYDHSQDSIMVHPPPPLPGMPPPPPPMPGTEPRSYVSPETVPIPMVPEPAMGPPPPPLLEMGPPPPPMPGMGPPPPPMPGMGPPPPSMPGMGPPPPPMPGMGPPPPPMPGMGPPPPPMPGMGPPPPPTPGMGPPPPPMPGMGPPPPPMPGMGPPPPPMPGMGPPPPPMSGLGPPPPPMSGMGPPPPPGMPGVGPGPPPPPPSLGPAPFPAPPVGGWTMQRATLRKTPVKPAAPMKPLYWTRILAIPVAPTCQGESETCLKPLWLEIEETKLDNIDEFTDLFSRQVVKAPVKKKVEVKTKIQPIKILDSKRSQNVGILAQSLHVEFSEIENAVYNFDTSVVTLEALQQIYELRATEEELSMIKEHLSSKPDIPLDKPEAFLHDLSGIPNFAERISCFMFQAEFEDAVSTTMHKLDNLKHTCEFLMTSESLKKLFAIILTLGNYMNGGNGQRGQADGFGLEILSKLKDVKSKQSNVTLLHFIVRTYMRACGGAMSDTCLLPVPEPGDVVRAATLDFADVAANLTTLRNQLTACNEKTKKVIETDAKSRNPNEEPTSGDGSKKLEVFKDKMTIFLNAAEEKLKTENDNLEECRAKFIATVKFYQYSPKCGKIEDFEPKEFFSLWTSFCSDFKDIYKKEEQLAVKEKLKEAKKMQDERKSSTLTQPKKEGGLKSRLQKLSSCRK